MSSNIVYTDGACSNNGKTSSFGGFGLYIKTGCFGEKKIHCKGKQSTYQSEKFPVTNIRMEGMAIIVTMFLYAEKYVNNKKITDIAKHLNNSFSVLPSKLMADSLYSPINPTVRLEEKLEIVTDSKFWIQVLTKWMPGWVNKEIVLTKKNPDLLILMSYYYRLLNVNGVKVILTHVHSHQKGKRTEHADGNDVADVLATSSVSLKDNLFYEV